eukprot:scaffold9851_cov100-Isochrysis_galbana.AAC.7
MARLNLISWSASGLSGCSPSCIFGLNRVYLSSPRPHHHRACTPALAAGNARSDEEGSAQGASSRAQRPCLPKGRGQGPRHASS